MSNNSRAIFFAINRVKHNLQHILMNYILPHKLLYYTLIKKCITYIMHAWSSRNTNNWKFYTKLALRIINNKGYRSHTDSLIQSKILQIIDVFKLHVSLFILTLNIMYYLSRLEML